METAHLRPLGLLLCVFLCVGLRLFATEFSPPEPIVYEYHFEKGVEPALAYGNGVLIAVWDSPDHRYNTIGSDYDLLFVRSTDFGATWTDHLVLNSNATTDQGDDRSPSLATDGAGNWICAWASENRSDGTLGSDADLFFSRSTNGGTTWSVPAILNSTADFDTEDDLLPYVLSMENGRWLVVWEGASASLGGDRDIFFVLSTDNGQSWTAAAPLNANAGVDSGDDHEPRLACDANGLVVALWHSSDSLGGVLGSDDDILLARSLDGGATWLIPQAIDSGATTDAPDHHDRFARIVTDQAGNWLALWCLHAPGVGQEELLSSWSTDAGQTWTSPAAAPFGALGSNEALYFPEIYTNKTGTWVAIWSMGTNTDQDGFYRARDVLFAVSRDNGASWSSTDYLAKKFFYQTPQSDYRPKLAWNNSGNWYGIYCHGSEAFESYPPKDRDFSPIATVKSHNDAASWSYPITFAGITQNEGTDIYPCLATDCNGTWMAAWSSGHYHDMGDWDLLFSFSRDDGVTWSVPGPLNISGVRFRGLEHIYPTIATNKAGVWMATAQYGLSCVFMVSLDDGRTWSEPRGYPGIKAAPVSHLSANDWLLAFLDSENYAHAVKLTENGLTSTLPETTPVSDSVKCYYTDMDHHASTCIVAYSSLGGIVYVRRSIDHAETWNVSQQLTGGIQATYGSIATNGSGEWMQVWVADNGSGRGLLALRSSDDGANWTAPQYLSGVSTGGIYRYPKVAADKHGTWMISWLESASPNTLHQYVQSSDFGITWSAPTNFASLNIELYHTLPIVPDNKGNWIAAWPNNWVEGFHDIQISRLHTNSNPTVESGPSALPNPTHLK